MVTLQEQHFYLLDRENQRREAIPSGKNNEKQQYEKMNCEQRIISLFFVYKKRIISKREL